MNQPITPTEPLFIDEQNDIINPLSIFVTRTTLRTILHTNGAKTLLELEARSTASTLSASVPSDTPMTE